MWSCIFSIVVGIWVMISPVAFSMNKPLADINHICGPLFITFAMIALWDINRSFIKANALVAVVLVIATHLMERGVAVLVSNTLFALFAFAAAFAKRSSDQTFGGGWKSLFQKNPPHLAESTKHSGPQQKK